MILTRRNRIFGLRVFDWERHRFRLSGHTRVVLPEPFRPIDRTQVYGYLQRMQPHPAGLLVLATRLEPLAEWWWGATARYLSWVRELMVAPRMGLIAVVRTQNDLAVLNALQQDGYPMDRLVIQGFPQELLVLPDTLRVDWIRIGEPDRLWKTRIPIRDEWVMNLFEQAADRQVPSMYASRSGWWPAHLGGFAWAERDGYLTGPRVPPLDSMWPQTYPSWVVKD